MVLRSYPMERFGASELPNSRLDYGSNDLRLDMAIMHRDSTMIGIDPAVASRIEACGLLDPAERENSSFPGLPSNHI